MRRSCESRGFWKETARIDFRANQQLCDGAIRCATDQVFPVHRAILSAVSPYFKALFTNSLKGGKTEITEVAIESVPGKIFSLILDYAYTGTCNVNADNVEQLLPLADQFEVLGVVQLCCQFLLRELRPENCLGQWAIFFSFHSFSANHFLTKFNKIIALKSFFSCLYFPPLVEKQKRVEYYFFLTREFFNTRVFHSQFTEKFPHRQASSTSRATISAATWRRRAGNTFAITLSGYCRRALNSKSWRARSSKRFCATTSWTLKTRK